MLNWLLRFWNKVLWFFTPKPSDLDKFLGVVQELISVQKAQLETQKIQGQFMTDWLKAINNPPPVTSQPSLTDLNLIENLQMSAEMGNPDAQEILADQSRLRDYLQSVRNA